MQPPLLGVRAARWVGCAVIVGCAVAVADCFGRFALEGLGTPAPVVPTKRLVVTGLYRYVRNPMYIAVVAAIMGQALLFGSLILLGYAALVWLLFVAFVVLYEEPSLQGRFGREYDDYRTNVPRWWPKLTPWQGPSAD